MTTLHLIGGLAVFVGIIIWSCCAISGQIDDCENEQKNERSDKQQED